MLGFGKAKTHLDLVEASFIGRVNVLATFVAGGLFEEACRLVGDLDFAAQHLTRVQGYRRLDDQTQIARAMFDAFKSKLPKVDA